MAGAMKYEEIMRDLKNKKYHPVYLLMGEEPYFIDKVTNYIAKNVLSADEKEFNQTVVYGNDTEIHALMGMARRFPLMANHQVVIVKEAQKLKKIEELQGYVENPLSSTLLVMAHKYKTIDKRKAFYKSIAKHAVVFNSDKLRDYKVPDWIRSYVKGLGFQIDVPTCQMLSEYLGNDLGKIANEMDKLALILPAGSEVSREVIQSNIGISKDYNIFELQHALAKRDLLKANRMVNYFAADPKNHPLPVVLSGLYNYFSKIMLYHYLPDKNEKSVAAELRVHPFFVKDYQMAARLYKAGKVARIISDLREYDLKSKGVNNLSANSGQLLKELVWKILH